jgi:glycosyltransferase involved in cell wall biosynthesis
MERFPACQLGVVIKCLNEEKNIARCIESALSAVQKLDAVVVVADSGSTDRTVEIASGYPVRVVQLTALGMKSCGLGAQLGYQFLNCEYVYILDGDMTLFDGALEKCLEVLAADKSLGGVGGIVEEMGGNNYEFERRRDTSDGAISGIVTALDMGGLYRVSALEGHYLTNMNLHSYEEKELAYRLQKNGYGLRRIDQLVVRHFGKTQDTTSLILKRWKTKHIDGPGELWRFLLSVADPKTGLQLFGNLVLVAASWALLLVAIGAALIDYRVSALLVLIVVAFHALMFAMFVARYRSLSLGLVGLVNINVLTAASVRGFLRRQTPPNNWIPSRLVR